MYWTVKSLAKEGLPNNNNNNNKTRYKLGKITVQVDAGGVQSPGIGQVDFAGGQTLLQTVQRLLEPVPDGLAFHESGRGLKITKKKFCFFCLPSLPLPGALAAENSDKSWPAHSGYRRPSSCSTGRAVPAVGPQPSPPSLLQKKERHRDRFLGHLQVSTASHWVSRDLRGFLPSFTAFPALCTGF